MAIPIYGCEAGGGRIITMDDEAVYKDLANAAGAGGNNYTPELVSTSFDVGLDGGYSKLRRLDQHVHHTTGVTVDQTPSVDEQDTGQTIQDVLATGANFLVTAPVAVTGTNFRHKISLSAFTAAVELGKALQWVIPRRSQR